MQNYSNISLTNALEINAPRGQIWKLIKSINIREVERKDKYSGGLTGGLLVPCDAKYNITVNKEVVPDFNPPCYLSQVRIWVILGQNLGHKAKLKGDIG